jgi:hypothetical protein
LSQTVITHTDSEHYIVNIASLHNYVPIALALLSHLQKSSFHINNETTLQNNGALQIQLAKQKPPPSAADESNPSMPSGAIEVLLTAIEDHTTTTQRNEDDQPVSDHKHETPSPTPLF